MKVMITGAAGFIGSQLAYNLWKREESLILLDDFSYGSLDNLVFPEHDFTNDIITMDVRDCDGIRDLLKDRDVDYIYHLAGIAPLPDCQINPQKAVEVNVGGSVNILENSRLYGVRKVIFASTNAMYENAQIFPTTESEFGLPSLIYPNTKYAAERFCQSYCDTYGMNVTCLRFANVYGPHIDCLRKQPPFVGYMIRELYYGRTPVFHSDGTQKRDYIYVQDLIDLALLVREGEGFDCVNVCSGHAYSVNELYEIAQEIMGERIEAEYASSENYWGKYPELYEGAYTIRPEVLEKEVTKYTLCSYEHAKEKYGWEPKVSIREGLKQSIDYEVSLFEKMKKVKNSNCEIVF